MDGATYSYGGRVKPGSFLSLQILLFFNYYYFWLWFVAEVLLFIYKGAVLPYPPGAYASEFSILALVLLIALIRYAVGTAGNKTERFGLMLWFLVLSIPTLGAAVYYCLFQVYVLRLEYALSIILILLTGFETVISVAALIFFKSSIV
uniref:Transmembrane protein 216 n=1 Tax=Chromera velia CCMP2878 TaxID=1169474 RepID=A0A0G4IF85_9ALVE|eukprot:Cvel_13974.t1-p1 / transcript=Cvel_13974.t1 / gene=Cvel_13974 / organism=Chromera_velia_CCMP2878 / gene_product=Transmembrane protein 216, putative / transcript_product=Transmembrane protein 216, putative / location=Cvel_scaffold976:42472-45029(+) / protein_length=147 / sequence_SO=supercontig / SO=protein_coding / is_pseudo=false